MSDLLTFAGQESDNSVTRVSSSVVAVVRKRGRCDSDPQGRPEKMYKGYEDTDTDTEMEGLMCASSASSASASASSASAHLLLGLEIDGSLPNSRSWKRDEEFYMEDGSCVFLVGDILFNVHRSILSKDSSSFNTMFSLPQGGLVSEGRTEDKPIILSGDTPDEFRHFLWALYALPSELKTIISPDANLVYLIDIAKVANKYSFKSMETWSLDVIQEYVNRKPSPILSAIPPPHLLNPLPSSLGQPITSYEPVDTADQLTRLIRLAQLCHHDRLLNTMIGLLRQLMSSSIQYAYLAMTLSDELDLRTLRGAAYLEVMHKADIVKKVNLDLLGSKPPTPLTGNTVSPKSTERLFITRAQQHRLLTGYYRLTSTWDKLRLTPLPFEHTHSCGATWHQQGCTQSWLEFWKEKTRSDTMMNLGQADVLGRLKLVQKDYDRWGSATYMHHDCRINAKKAIVDMIKKVEEALPDYFAEPGESGDD